MTWKFAVRETYSAASKAGTSRRSATRCIASYSKTRCGRWQNLPPALSAEVDIDLPVEAFLAPEYVSDMRHKIDLYRRIAKTRKPRRNRRHPRRVGRPFWPATGRRESDAGTGRTEAGRGGLADRIHHKRRPIHRFELHPATTIETLAKQSRFPVRIVDSRRAYVPLRPQKKPGTNKPPPKNYEGVDLDDPTGVGYLTLARGALRGK